MLPATETETDRPGASQMIARHTIAPLLAISHTWNNISRALKTKTKTRRTSFINRIDSKAVSIEVHWKTRLSDKA